MGIQVLGISLTDKNLHPIMAPTPSVLKYVGNLGFVISFLSPYLALRALMTVRSDIATTNNPVERKFIWLLVILALLLSLPESLWSCGGHPTWYMGFADQWNHRKRPVLRGKLDRRAGGPDADWNSPTKSW
jgi:hypothetical protein